MPSVADRGRNLWGAIVVIVGLLVIAGVFGGTVWKFSSADSVVAVLGLVTGVVGIIVTAFFGIHATAAAGTDAATAAAYANPEKAGELADKLRGVDPSPPGPGTAEPAPPEQARGWSGGLPGPAPEIDPGKDRDIGAGAE
jgi:hypothetical protein